MSSRKHEAGVWDFPWFRKLGPAEKGAYFFIWDHADSVGVWVVDTETAEFFIGSRVNWDGLASAWGEDLVRLDEQRLWIRSYIEVVYGKINPRNEVHKRIVGMLERLDLYNRLPLRLLPGSSLDPVRVQAGASQDPGRVQRRGSGASGHEVGDTGRVSSGSSQEPDRVQAGSTQDKDVDEDVEYSSLSSGEEELEESLPGDRGGGDGEEGDPEESGGRPEKGPQIRYDFVSHMWEGITDELVKDWGVTYPACDVELELRKMAEWCESNGAKGHKQKWRRFITNWLSRQQDKGGSVAAPRGARRW